MIKRIFSICFILGLHSVLFANMEENVLAVAYELRGVELVFDTAEGCYVDNEEAYHNLSANDKDRIIRKANDLRDAVFKTLPVEASTVFDTDFVTKLLKPTPPTSGSGTPAAGSDWKADRKEEDIEREVGQFWPNGEKVVESDPRPEGQTTGTKRKLKCVVTGTIEEEQPWVVERPAKKAQWTMAQPKDGGGSQTLQDVVNSIAAASAA